MITSRRRRVHNDNNKYISKALNPSISDPHEAQSAVNAQLKPSKTTHKKTKTKNKNKNKNKQTNKKTRDNKKKLEMGG